jgi:hypothetical protein
MAINCFLLRKLAVAMTEIVIPVQVKIHKNKNLFRHCKEQPTLFHYSIADGNP